MGLHDLASLILVLNQGPISRVRFSRTIYFVHKELVRKKLMQPDDIAYLRLPLGPVPEGFLTLAVDHPSITIRPITDSNLSYESEEFIASELTTDALTPNSPLASSAPNPSNLGPSAPNPSSQQNPLLTKSPSHLDQQRLRRAVQRTLLALRPHPTSELVAASHDHSWAHHKNGDRYFITPVDLRNTFPFLTISLRLRLRRPTNNEIGLLQATLLRGMLNDIVRESTDLEYPDEAPKSKLGSTQPPSKPGTAQAKPSTTQPSSKPKPTAKVPKSNSAKSANPGPKEGN